MVPVKCLQYILTSYRGNLSIKMKSAEFMSSPNCPSFGGSTVLLVLMVVLLIIVPVVITLIQVELLCNPSIPDDPGPEWTVVIIEVSLFQG